MDALAPFATAARAYAAAAPTWALALVAVGAVLSLLNAWLWLKKAPYRRIPGPPSYFLIGHVPYLVTEPWKQFYRFALQYGSVYKMWVWDKLFVVVTDPDLVKHVFLTKRHIYPKDAWSYKFFMDILGHGVVTSDGPVWKAKRQLLNPAFHFTALERLQVTCFDPAASRLMSKLYAACEAAPSGGPTPCELLTRHGSSAPNAHYDFARSEVVYTPLGGGRCQVELSSTFRAFTLEIISQVALGLRPEQASVFPALFEAVLDELNQRVLAPWRGWIYPRLQRQHAARLRRLNDIVYGMIAARRAAAEAAKRAAGPATASSSASSSAGGDDANDGSGAGLSITGRPIFADGTDMLDMILDSAPHLTDTELADEVKTQLLAGHETSSMMLTWAMYLLAAPGNEAAMARAVAEADAVLGTAATPSFRDYKNLEYIGWVLNEAMRLYSPVPLLNRESSEGDTLGGYAIPAGTAIIVSIWALHKNPAIWGPDAEAFRPERFSPEESRGRHAWCFLPFSQGPRNCIGQHLAISEAKVVLGKLLRRFTITLAPGQEAPQTDAFVIPTRPQKPLFVNLAPRPGKRF